MSELELPPNEKEQVAAGMIFLLALNHISLPPAEVTYVKKENASFIEFKACAVFRHNFSFHHSHQPHLACLIQRLLFDVFVEKHLIIFLYEL